MHTKVMYSQAADSHQISQLLPDMVLEGRFFGSEKHGPPGRVSTARQNAPDQEEEDEEELREQ